MRLFLIHMLCVAGAKAAYAPHCRHARTSERVTGRQAPSVGTGAPGAWLIASNFKGKSVEIRAAFARFFDILTLVPRDCKVASAQAARDARLPCASNLGLACPQMRRRTPQPTRPQLTNMQAAIRRATYGYSQPFQTSGQYPTVALAPLRTMGSRRTCWFSSSLSNFWLSARYVISATVS